MQHLYEKVGLDRVGHTASDVLPEVDLANLALPRCLLWEYRLHRSHGLFMWFLRMGGAWYRTWHRVGARSVSDFDCPPAVLKVNCGCSISIPLPSDQCQNRLMTHDIGIVGSVCRPHHTKLQSIVSSSSPFSDNHGDSLRACHTHHTIVGSP